MGLRAIGSAILILNITCMILGFGGLILATSRLDPLSSHDPFSEVCKLVLLYNATVF